jgi:VWFA-related protein
MKCSLAAARLAGLLWLVSSGLVAQQADRPQPSKAAPVFPVEAHIVWIDVVAADSAGRPVADLALEDFEVVEGGERRPIVLFRAPADGAPANRAVAFLIDDITATAQQVQRARDAVRHTLEAAAGDRVVLTATASGVSASAVLPDGAPMLRTELDRIRAHPDLMAALAEPEQARRLHWGRVEAVVAALQALQGHAGPRALVIIGPSLPYRASGPFGRAAHERVMRASERAAAPIYFLKFGEDTQASWPTTTRSPDWITGTGGVIGVAPLLPMAPGETSAMNTAVLDTVSLDSGGLIAPNPAAWPRVLDRIFAARAYYLLGIPSVPETWDGGYHRVEVRVLRKDVRLYARKGYFAPAAAPQRKDPERQ